MGLEAPVHKDMIKIETLEISGLASVLKSLRLPFGKECRSEVVDEYIGWVNEPEILNFAKSYHVNIHPKDMALMSTLVRRGDEHAKAIRGLVVYAEIDAPIFWWSEMDTYRIGTERLSSASTMHTLGKEDVTINNFSVSDTIIDMLTPTKGYTPQALFVDTPEDLKSEIFTYNNREYEVWNNGDIYSMPYDVKFVQHGKECVRHYDKRKITPSLKPDGYYSVRLGGSKGGNMQHHRVLALCFVENDNPQVKTQVNHIDGNRSNNSISNLEWVSALENTRHSIEIGNKKWTDRFRYLTHKNGIKYTKEVVEDIIKMREQGATLKEIADMFDTCESTICQASKKYDNYVKNDFETAEYYENVISRLNELAESYRETNDVGTLIEMKQMLPSSFKQTRIQMFSYQCLRNIVKQRHNHRLPEWHAFVDWVRTLPFANELIFVGLGIN